MRYYWLRLPLLAIALSFSFAASAQDGDWLLTERVEVSNGEVGFTTAYPSGWTAEDAPNATVLYEQADDEQAALEGNGVVTGYVIQFQYFTAREAQALGLPEDAPRLDQWLGIMNALYHNETPATISEATFLSWPALRVQTTDSDGNAAALVAGFVGTVPYAITLSAPDSDALDAFLPTWEQMLRESRLFKGAVNLGEYSLYLDCLGEGSPTVILEQGMNAGYDYLRRTQEQVAEFTRVCIHEREKPELGRRTARDFAEDLHQLLQNAHVEGPYVFAAHSFGGFVARMYEAEYPDEVVGMVLINSAHEDQLSIFQSIVVKDYYERVVASIRSDPTVDFEASAAQVSEVGDLGDMPLVVLTLLYDDITSAMNEEVTSLLWAQTWFQGLQPGLAQLSTNGRLVMVDDADNATLVRSQTTIDAIQEVVNAVRGT